MKKIGVIGNGFVGNAVASGFKKYAEIRVHDIDPLRSTHDFENTISCDYVFVCLPTPMKTAEGSECNLSIIHRFFNEVPEDCKSIFIIKSTVPIGTTDSIIKEHPNLKIIHNPEFLTAANAETDFIESDRHVLGGKREWTKKVEFLYKRCFPKIPVFKMKSSESEAVKYFANCFLASKVMVFNEMKMLCDNLNSVDYDKVIEGVISDTRIGESHTSVPGPDGDYGFGGTCFPKDINALIHTMEQNGVNPIVLKSVWNQNKNYRKNWDWAENTSAVMGDNYDK